MAKAAEVYTRLKSRVLGPKVEALQKVNKAGAEKDRVDVEKVEEQPGEQAPRELVEDEPSTGEGRLQPARGTDGDCTRVTPSKLTRPNHILGQLA